MSINKQCLIKSLKSDYKWIGKALVVVLGVAAILYCIITYDEIIFSFLASIGADVIFAICECLAMLVFPIILVLDSDTKNKDNLKGNYVTPLVMIANSVTMVLVYLLYSIASCPIESSPGVQTVCSYPDVFWIFISVLVVNVLIVSPLFVAYLRCRNE